LERQLRCFSRQWSYWHWPGCPQEAEETVFSDDAGLQSITLNDVD
jgi:hypothetical protein